MTQKVGGSKPPSRAMFLKCKKMHARSNDSRSLDASANGNSNFMKAMMLTVFLCACTPAQRNWRKNVSVDTGMGTQSLDPQNIFGYTGLSYWLGHGISVSGGVWRTVFPEWGPSVGVNYSITPFD